MSAFVLNGQGMWTNRDDAVLGWFLNGFEMELHSMTSRLLYSWCSCNCLCFVWKGGWMECFHFICIFLAEGSITQLCQLLHWINIKEAQNLQNKWLFYIWLRVKSKCSTFIYHKGFSKKHFFTYHINSTYFISETSVTSLLCFTSDLTFALSPYVWGLVNTSILGCLVM